MYTWYSSPSSPLVIIFLIRLTPPEARLFVMIRGCMCPIHKISSHDVGQENAVRVCLATKGHWNLIGTQAN